MRVSDSVGCIDCDTTEAVFVTATGGIMPAAARRA